MKPQIVRKREGLRKCPGTDIAVRRHLTVAIDDIVGEPIIAASSDPVSGILLQYPENPAGGQIDGIVDYL